jgi:hypothetical protein
MKEESKSSVRQSTKDRVIQQKEAVNKGLKQDSISFPVNALLGFGS